MPRYKYTAKDTGGNTVKGVVNAANVPALYDQLREQNLILIDSKAVGAGQTRNVHLKSRQLSEFCRSLGTMMEAGVSLVRAMNIIAKDEKLSKREQKMYHEMVQQIRQGAAFSEAMEEQGQAFPVLLTNMFRAAEASGTMSKTAMRMAEHYQKEYRLQSRVNSAMTYPKILLVVVFLVLLGVFGYIMPRFSTLFVGMELPAVTRFYMGVSAFVSKNWWAVLLAAALLWILFYYLMQVRAVRYQIDKYKLKIWKFGYLFSTIYTARFARTLCSLYTSGVPILSAMQVVRGTIGNLYLEDQFGEAIAAIRRGESLSDAISVIDGFEKKLVSSIAIGEEAGSLDSMLISLADSYDYDADQAVGRMVTWLEPVLILVMAALVGSIMIAVMLPLSNSYATFEDTVTETYDSEEQ